MRTTAVMSGLLALLALVAVPVGTASAVASQASPTCTFASGGLRVGSFGAPIMLAGLSSGGTVSVTCTGLTDTDTYGLFQVSPLAMVTQPFTIDVFGSEANVIQSLPTFAAPIGGVYSASTPVGTTAAGTFVAGASGVLTIPPDPNAQCPPAQAEINAALGTCVLTVLDITAASAKGATPSQADFVGEALLDFSGQAKPKVPPTISFDSSAATPGRAVKLTDAGAKTHWWGGGWWSGGYPGGGITPAPLTIPSSNVLVDGTPATSSSVKVDPPLYCFYGASSARTCKTGTGDTPGNGQLFPSPLKGTVTIPATTRGANATVSIYEHDGWGTAFPGNNTNPAFPSKDLTGTGSIPLG